MPSATAVDVVAQLAALGAGGVVCYTAGFRELGGVGAELEKVLAEVAGDLALVGPNVFGLLNYVSGAHLWPYAHGGKRVERGVALVSQSGMFSGYVTTNQRSVAFSYVIGSGSVSNRIMMPRSSRPWSTTRQLMPLACMLKRYVISLVLQKSPSKHWPVISRLLC